MKIDVVEFSGRNAVIRSEGEIDPFLEANATLRTQQQKSDWGRHVARVPNIITVKWLNEEWNRGNDIRLFSKEWNELVERKLQDPDWAYLRVDGPRASYGYGD